MPKEYLKSISFQQIERNQTSELLTLQMQTPLAVFGFINDLYFNQALQLWNHNHLHLNCVHHLGHLFVCFFFSTWVGIMNVSYQTHSHILYHDMIQMKLNMNSKCFMKHSHMNVLSCWTSAAGLKWHSLHFEWVAHDILWVEKVHFDLTMFWKQHF